jgi:uncharacterized repeat protein (TIGR03803 family)
MIKLSGWKMGCAVILLCVTSAVVAPAQTFTNLFTFDETDGATPMGILTQGIDGNFYGVTLFGGTKDGGQGTAFRMTPTGGFSSIYNFCSKANCADGTSPFWAVILGTDGNFHGTTTEGNPNTGGTVYTLTSAGKLGVDGNYYGTTRDGGNGPACVDTGDCGNVFKTTPSGATTTIYNFCSQPNCTDGILPTAALVQGTDGNFYGSTTELNGIPATIFKLTPKGTLTTLYTFPVPWTGVSPLIQGTDGSFYGTIPNGGNYGYGMAFKITSSGSFTTLHSFCANFGCTDGSGPGGLVQGIDGNFYGTTSEGGENASGTNGGTIFSLSPTGLYNVLYNFCSQSNCADGTNPSAPLIQGTNGNFYGLTSGGNLNRGTIYSLATGLGPFVKFLPAGGRVGGEVGILGNSLSGATSVTFNGTSAKFSIVSSTLILTHVPAGAKSGPIKVTLPSGTLTSNVAFQVIP